MIKHDQATPKPSGLWGYLRSCIMRGALFLLPIAVTAIIVHFALGFVEDYLGGPTAALVRAIVPARVLGPFQDGHVPGLSMALLLLVMFGLGAIASWRFGHRGLRVVDVIAPRIPFIGGIYTSTRKIVDSFGESDRFQRVVQLRIFGGELRGLAFVTAETIDEATGEKWLCVFFPHIPNPTSGLLLWVPEKETLPCDIKPQEGFKWLMSLGTLTPAQMNITGIPRRNGV